MNDLKQAVKQAIEALDSDNPEIQLQAVIKVLVEMSASAEREACAKVCDEARAARLAEQIRARGEK